MFKYFVGLALAAVVAVPSVSSAAVNHETFGFTVNGQSSGEVRAGSSYKIGFLADVDGGDDIDSFRVRHYNQNGDIVNTKCVTVNPPIGSGDDVQVLRNVPTMSECSQASMIKRYTRSVSLDWVLVCRVMRTISMVEAWISKPADYHPYIYAR